MNTVETTTPKSDPRLPGPSNGSDKAYLAPRVDIFEEKDAYVLEAEMPGVTKEGLEILLENNELTLVGRRSAEKIDAELVYRESSTRDFRRVFLLNPTIDASKIEAKLEDGLLSVTLPKAEELRPRRIKVND